MWLGVQEADLTAIRVDVVAVFGRAIGCAAGWADGCSVGCAICWVGGCSAGWADGWADGEVEPVADASLLDEEFVEVAAGLVGRMLLGN